MKKFLFILSMFALALAGCSKKEDDGLRNPVAEVSSSTQVSLKEPLRLKVIADNPGRGVLYRTFDPETGMVCYVGSDLRSPSCHKLEIGTVSPSKLND